MYILNLKEKLYQMVLIISSKINNNWPKCCQYLLRIIQSSFSQKALLISDKTLIRTLKEPIKYERYSFGYYGML